MKSSCLVCFYIKFFLVTCRVRAANSRVKINALEKIGPPTRPDPPNMPKTRTQPDMWINPTNVQLSTNTILNTFMNYKWDSKLKLN